MPATVGEPRSDCRIIHEAAKKGELEIVRALLKHKRDLVFSKDEDGGTPLHLAAGYGRKHVAELLLANNADVNAKDTRGQTSLHAAATFKNVAELLLASKADVNAIDNDGCTPLHVAADFGFEKDVVELLIANGAEVNAKANSGSTPLHSAASGGHKLVVEVLIANKADLNARNNTGKTPFDCATGAGQKRTAETLRWLDPTNPEANLERWRASDQPETWVWAHLPLWNHHEWLALLANLRRSQYWPMDEAAIGQHLEMLKATLPPLPPAPSAMHVTFQREDRWDNGLGVTSKRLYTAKSRRAAVTFLRSQRVTEPFFYIEVHTPSGIFGIDIENRIYDTKGHFIEAVHF